MHYYYVIYGENYYRRAGSPVAYNDTIHRSEKQSKKPENFTARAGSQTSWTILAQSTPWNINTYVHYFSSLLLSLRSCCV